MKAVVFKGPHRIALEDRPIPKLINETDVLVKVSYTALCGSELHVFRGHQPSDTGFIMGHEFTGTVVEVGKEVTGFQAGDKVVSPFTTSCLECFYCRNGYTSRCTQSMLYGSVALDGGQAEYVRVPLADGTLFKAPPEIPEETVNATVVLIGCGPVGLCALIAATSFSPARIFAIDSVPSRLELAKSLGAEPLNFMEDERAVKERILEATDGRGADVVLEVVGNSPALRMGFDVVRSWGLLISVGVHNAEIPFTGNEAYNKNVRIQFGRCPVRAIFPEALALLKEKSHLLGFMADKIMPMTQAEEGYELFDKMKVQKVIFRADQ
ncbi:chaperonin 10-like protein [Tuber borchii]|uniref:Chaperonin 10-like protein n=1 Tax=Tuber borchii TaxID=42251 RepID=A0A2T6ZYZ2_TUBBO|nr:chaperonin 10-like protein [Tuber borchii]